MTTPSIQLSSGAEMPALGLGTWRLNGAACERAVRWALELGYRHVDTAAMYRNEESVGAAIRASGVPRDEVFVTTKLANRDHARPGAAAGESVRRLGLDYIDCDLIHWPAGRSADLEVWSELQRQQQKGLLLAIGVSNYSVAQMAQLIDSADIPPAVNQVEMNPFVHPRDIEDACRDRGVALQAYQPIARARAIDHPTLAGVAERVGRTPAQVMLRWGVQRGAAVLPKSGNRDRIAANGQIFDFALPDAEMTALDELG